MFKFFLPGFLAAAMGFASIMPATAQAPIKIRIGYAASTDFAAAFVAKEEGFFAERGVDAELVFTGQGGAQTAALVGGSLDIGVGLPPSFFQAIEGGLDLVIVAGGTIASRDLKSAIGLVARTGSNIKTAKDLAGKRVAVGAIGGPLHVIFQAWLRENGVDPKQIMFVEIPFPSQSDALKSGSVDAALPVDPILSRMISAGTGYYAADYMAVTPEDLAIVFFEATRRWADAHRSDVEAFQAAIADGAAFVVAHPDKTREDVAKFIKMPPDVIAKMVMATPDPAIRPQQLAWWISTLVRLGALDGDPGDLDRLIYR